MLFKYLQEISEDEVVLFTDGHDTILMAGELEIMTKFADFGSPLVFSTEINCWPTPDLRTKYPPTSHRFKYLNCGGFIGRAGYLVELYNKYPLFADTLKKEFTWSNQYFWHHVYLKNMDTIRLDHNCELFYNTATLLEKMKGLKFNLDNPRVQEVLRAELARLCGEILFTDNRINYNTTNNFPVHLHFPGPFAKQLMNTEFFKPVRPWEYDKRPGQFV